MDKPTNTTEFHNFMLEIDSRLKKKRIPVQVRPLYAFKLIGTELNIQLQMAPVGRPIKNNFDGNSFSAHIIKWFDDIYGDNLKVDFSLADIIVLIKQDPYRCSIPRLFGSSITFVLDENIQNKQGIITRRKGEPSHPIPFNVYQLISGLTSPQIKLLTDDDKKELLQFFVHSFRSIYKLNKDSSFPFLIEAKSDFKVAVDSILSNGSNFGLSKWSSLQFSEKIMKGLLKKNHIAFSYTHNLTTLNNILRDNKITDIPDKIISKINCSADVRYDKNLIDIYNAIEAHHASLKLLEHCFK